MNIFVLDTDPYKSAEMMCDKHVVKMLIETCQILSAVVDNRFNKILDGKPSVVNKLPQYPKAHVKHPCTIWAMEARDNSLWLNNHLHGLSIQFKNRFPRKEHKLTNTHLVYGELLESCAFERTEMTPFAQAMPEVYKADNPVVGYRNYYLMDKTFAAWKNTPPQWFKEGRSKMLQLVKAHNSVRAA